MGEAGGGEEKGWKNLTLGKDREGGGGGWHLDGLIEIAQYTVLPTA